MTVSSTTSKVSYSGNGSTTTFTVPYYFLANTHLSVILRSVSGVETTKALTADYTVSGAGSPSGGSVTMIVAPATGETLVILRSVPYTQDVDYQTNDPFPANTHEMALDKLTMEVQQLAEASGRALTLSPTTSGVSNTLPAPSSNKIIGWDTTATVLQNYDPSSLLTAVGSSGFSTQLFSGNGSQTAFTLSQAPGIIANLDVFISGVRQRPTTDYTLLSNTLTFLTPPASGTNNIFCKWGQTFGIGVVADGGVKTSSFDPTAVAPSATNVAGTGVITYGNLSSNVTAILYGKNRIINGNFAINQRGYVSGAAVGANLYGHDRWKMASSADTYTFSGSTITIPVGKTLSQVIEGNNLQTGTYTLSWTGTAQGKIGAGSFGASGITGSITSGINTTITFNDGTLSNVQLEFGSVATQFEARPFGLELALCQRYYESGQLRWDGYATTGVNFSSSMSYKVTKRAAGTPSIANISVNGFSAIPNYVNIGNQLDAIGIYHAATATAGANWVDNWTIDVEL